MEITFDKAIDEGQIDRKGITVNHIIIYPDVSIILNNNDSSSKTIPFDTLSGDVATKYTDFINSLTGDIKTAYVSKVVE